MPPLRYAPTGTSRHELARHGLLEEPRAALRRTPSSTAASRRHGELVVPVARARESALGAARSIVSSAPGGSSRTPSNSVRSLKMFWKVKYSSSAVVVDARGDSSGCARIALISEPNSDALGRCRVVERLDAVAIARQEQPRACRAWSQKREGEHAVEALDARVAPLLVGVQRRPRCRCASGTGGPSASSSARSSRKL